MVIMHKIAFILFYYEVHGYGGVHVMFTDI